MDAAAEAALSRLEKLFSGRSEKRRFFKLVRLEEKNKGVEGLLTAGRSGASRRDLTNFASVVKGVELRYYSKESATDDSLKGTILLTHECELVTKPDDTTLKLVTPGRTYYLRPDGDAKSGAAATDASQWADAIRREIRTLWNVEHLTKSRGNLLSPGSMGLSSPNLPMDRRLDRGESNVDFLAAAEEELPSTLEEVLKNDKSRSQFREFLDAALATENLAFYEAVEALAAHAAAAGGSDVHDSCVSIVKEFVLAGSPREVNLSSQQRARLADLAKQAGRKMVRGDFDEARAEIFKLMDENFFKRFVLDASKRTGAFSALYATLGLDGFTAVLNHFGPVKTDLDRTLLALRATAERVKAQIDVLNSELSTSSRDVAMTAQRGLAATMRASYALSIARLDALTTYWEELRSEVIAPLEAFRAKLETDLNTIMKQISGPLSMMQTARRLVEESMAAFEKCRANPPSPQALDAARQDVINCESALENAETANSRVMEQAMSKLESLELLRIETQTSLMRHALKAEVNMNKDVLARATEVFELASALDVDMQLKVGAAAAAADLMAASGGSGPLPVA